MTIVDASGGIKQTQNRQHTTWLRCSCEQARIVRRSLQGAGERRSLVDVLNARRSTRFKLEAVQVCRARRPVAQFPDIIVEKRAIIAAIPRETAGADQQRHDGAQPGGPSRRRCRLAVTMVIAAVRCSRVRRTLLQRRHSGRKVPSASSDLFTRFFSVTDATLTLAGRQPTRSADPAGQPRDLVAATARHRRRRRTPLTARDCRDYRGLTPKRVPPSRRCACQIASGRPSNCGRCSSRLIISFSQRSASIVQQALEVGWR